MFRAALPKFWMKDLAKKKAKVGKKKAKVGKKKAKVGKKSARMLAFDPNFCPEKEFAMPVKFEEVEDEIEADQMR